MTTLAEIFAKPVDRPFNSVINIDDQNHLNTEFEEYVITRELRDSLDTFLDNYGDYRENCAVWISGYYGSGKSHLLKMLALLLENRPLPGTTKTPLDYFLDKASDFHDPSLKAGLSRLQTIPAESIFFNIKAKSSAGDREPVLGPFLRVFNDHCGYYGAQNFIAAFERDLDRQGKLEAFKTRYRELSRESWEHDRSLYSSKTDYIDQAFGAVTGQNTSGIISSYREDEKQQNFNIDDFCSMVSDYIKKKSRSSPGFRLNFFVDEAGQFIADQNERLLSLQTLAECLKKHCNGRAWLLVTAQEELQALTGDRSKTRKADASKIQDRFGIRIHLGSANVEEVLQKRLLAKHAQHLRELQELYAREHANFHSLFDFAKGPGSGRSYNNFTDEKHFIASYPFIPWQYALYQDCIRSLAENNALEGKIRSRGERSLLGDFREVLNRIKNEPLGRLAGFDLLCNSLSSRLSPGAASEFLAAQKNPALDAFALRVLKALFLVKYSSEVFTASARNLQILLYDDFGIRLNELRDQIHNALNILVAQKFVEKNGDNYSFLTAEEKDIESRIQALDCDSAEIRDELAELFFSPEIVKTRYTDTRSKTAWPCMHWVDGCSKSRTAELGIALYTFLSGASKDEILTSSDSGRDRCNVCVLLPEDRQELYGELVQYLKTRKYLKSRSPGNATEPVQRILSSKRSSNESRHLRIRQDFAGLIATAEILVKGHPVPEGSSAAARISAAFSRLVDAVYSRRLTECFDENTLKQYLTPGFLNPAAELSGPELTLLNRLVNLRKNQDVPEPRVCLGALCADLHQAPYGWKEIATVCLAAALLAKNKLRLVLEDGRTLTFADAPAALEFLSGRHKWEQVALEPVSAISRQQVNRLRELYQTLTDHSLETSDFERITASLQELFRGAYTELEQLLPGLPELPLKSALRELSRNLKELAEHQRDFFSAEINRHESAIRELWKNRERFCLAAKNGNFKVLADAAGLIKTLQSSCPELLPEAEKLQALLQDPNCYAGPGYRQLKALREHLKKDFASRLAAARAGAQAYFTQSFTPLFAELKQQDAASQTHGGSATARQLEELLKTRLQQLEAADNPATISLIKEDFTQREYPALIANLNRHPGSRQSRQVVSLATVLSGLRQDAGTRLSSQEELEKFTQNLHRALQKLIAEHKDILL